MVKAFCDSYRYFMYAMDTSGEYCILIVYKKYLNAYMQYLYANIFHKTCKKFHVFCVKDDL